MQLNITTITLVAILGLAAIAFYGLLISRNMIKLVVALQILVKGAILAFILAGNIQAPVTSASTSQAVTYGAISDAQTLALTIIVADTIVAVLGLAFAVQIRRRFGTLDIKALTTLKR